MKKLAPRVALLLAAFVATASANGRPAGTSSIHFRQGMEREIAAGLTFGLVISKDDGATWHWICEDAIKYAGVYDPIYTYTSSGALFATTFDGALVNRNDCAFENTALGAGVFASTMQQGPDGAVYMAVSQPQNPPGDAGDAKIYRSTDNGLTFPVSANPGQVGDWWDSIFVAPSNPQRVYLTGYRLNSGDPRVQLLFRSNDGGATYTPMGTTGLAFSNDSTIDVVGVDKMNPDIVYAQVDFLTPGVVGEAIFKSTDGGATWAKIFEKGSGLVFLARASGELVAASQSEGLYRAAAGTTTFTEVVGAPHINCLAEKATGEVWACTQNFGAPGVPADGAGIMKSSDLTTWSNVLVYQDIQGPVACEVGTLQRDACVDKEVSGSTNWCTLRRQLGIAADPTCCAPLGDEPVPACLAVPEEPGCCDTSGTGAKTGLLASLFVGSLLLRKRRRA